MNTKRFGFAGVFAAFALAVSTLVAPSASAATEIVVWADESRGPNLTKVIAAKGDWVAGYTVKVVTFSSFDALKDAFDKATDASGPDIVVGGNDWVPTGAKSGKLAPLALTAAVKARFNPTQFLDLTYKGKLYGVPVDINNVAMIYNTKLVSSAPKTFGEMVQTTSHSRPQRVLRLDFVLQAAECHGELTQYSQHSAQMHTNSTHAVESFTDEHLAQQHLVATFASI